MQARDLMIPLTEHLTPGMTLKQAAQVLRSANRGEERIGVKGLPVLDQQGRMVGFLSIGDLLKSVIPSYMSLTNVADFSWEGLFEDMARKVGDRLVGAVMTTAVISVPEEARLMVCVDQMIKHGVKRLPVLGEGGRVTGILYERDVFEAICDIMLSVTGEKLG